MSVQQFCLRWNNHQPNFISVCSSLLHNGTLVDVTLAAEGRQLQAHKIVLSACSSYFQTLFTSNPCQHPIVILKDVQYNDLKTMVDFMYYGEVNVSQEQLPHILKTAEMLKIKGLAEMPDAAGSLTKSESKSSSDQTEQLQAGSGESLWGSTDSHFQHHHHHHLHQQHQLQTHHQQRRTPSPTASGASPATRRKRLRKSSNSGSTERTSEEQSSVEGPTNINLSQMGQMSFGGAGSNLTQTLHTKIIKESSSTDTDTHPQDSSQESIDDATSHQHHVQQIKPEADLSNVQQSIPLDISGPTTPSEQDGPNVSCSQSQSSHSEKIEVSAAIGSKRNRFLIRQPRIKRDSDTNQQSPEIIELDHISSRNLLSVPPKIERHASEPAPSMTSSSSHLLSVPQSTPFLVKQHSHPLLPSHSPPMHLTSSGTFSLHRQYSQPTPISEPIFSTNACILSTNAITPTSSMVQFTSSSSGGSTIKHEVETSPCKITGPSTPIVLLSDPLAISGNTDHLNTIRVKSEELQRSSSTPQTLREPSLDNPRSSHCPVIRPGPALGCNFCWNTIDAHGRILRRKTKYHCPECQTNLCIVPCFQEYHERQSNDNPSSENISTLTTSSKSLSSTGLRHYPKTGSI